VLDVWVKGLSLDWELLYDGRKPDRISLPTYPFAREHYWMSRIGTHPPIHQHPQKQEVSQAAAVPAEGTAVLTFEEVWQPQPADPSAPAALSAPRTVVCWLSQPQAQQELAATLQELEPQCTLVFLTQSQGDPAAVPPRYAIDPRQRATIRQG